MSLEQALRNLDSLEKLQRLLVEELGFEPEDRAVVFDDDDQHLAAIYPQPQVSAGSSGFYVLTLPSASDDGMRKTRQRQAVEALKSRYPLALFIFASPQADTWQWVYPKPATTQAKRSLRRLEIGRDPRQHTVAERLTLLQSRLGTCENAAQVARAVEDAFDVEAIGKQFFREYQGQYWAFKQRIRLDNPGKTWVYDDAKLSRYVQLLLGRILFLHFIERKGWLNGDANFLRSQFAPFQRKEASGFHQSVLTPLFFEALNQPGDRKTINGQEVKIRFLNGGLFEERREFEEQDPLFCPLVADELYVSLFAMLGRYNFTVDEATPLDQTVGIDPEMLGKVFENLLEAEARHASGTYYTPRAIVAYMCRETLFRHCQAQTGIDRTGFQSLFEAALEGRQPEIGKALVQRLDAVLDQVKVLDPAVGSGAFLLGMLQEILTLKESLARARGDAEEQILAERAKRKARIIHESLYAVDISFPAIEIARLRLWLALVVDEDEPHPLPNLDYHIVRGDTLATLLDGKALMPPSGGASGMAPRGQVPLPMAGAQMSFDDAANPHTAALLRHLDTLYAANGEEKARLRREIKRELVALIEQHWRERETELEANLRDQEKKQHQGQIVFRGNELKLYRQHHAQIAAIAEQRQRLRASVDSQQDIDLPFTPLHLYFAEVFAGTNPGFDIVIANPPYVRHEEIKDIKPRLEAEFPRFYTGTADLYTYFYKRGLELLKAGGRLCFIAPNKFMRAGYGKNTRKLLTTEAAPEVVIDFGELPVFEAGTDPSILLVQKHPSPSGRGAGGEGAGTFTASLIKDAADIERVGEAVAERGFSMNTSDLLPEGWTLESPAVLTLMKKLREKGTPLGEYLKGRFYYGIKTGFNDAFVIDAAKRAELIAEDPKSAEVIKPWLRGRDIRKWKAEWAGLYVIFVPWHFPLHKDPSISGASRKAEAEFQEKFPAVYSHLLKFKSGLVKRNQAETGIRYEWYALQRWASEYWQEFDQPKIVYADIAKFFRASWDEQGAYLGNTCYFIPTDDKYLFALLRSSLFDYYYRQNFQPLGDPFAGGRIRFFSQDMELLPIYPASDSQTLPILQRVEAILANPTGPDVPRLEAEIDDLVFDLYGLTDAEREMVWTACANAQQRVGSDEEEKPSKRATQVEKTRGIWAGLPEFEED